MENIGVGGHHSLLIILSLACSQLDSSGGSHSTTAPSVKIMYSVMECCHRFLEGFFCLFCVLGFCLFVWF